MGVYEDIQRQMNPYTRVQPQSQSLYRGGGGASRDWTRSLTEQEIMNNSAFDEFEREKKLALALNDPQRIAMRRQYNARYNPTAPDPSIGGKFGNYTPGNDARDIILGGKGNMAAPPDDRRWEYQQGNQQSRTTGNRFSGANPLDDLTRGGNRGIGNQAFGRRPEFTLGDYNTGGKLQGIWDESRGMPPMEMQHPIFRRPWDTPTRVPAPRRPPEVTPNPFGFREADGSIFNPPPRRQFRVGEGSIWNPPPGRQFDPWNI